MTDPLTSLPVINVWLVVKYLYLFVIAMYIIFAVIMVRQIHLMTSTLNGNFDFSIKVIGYVHFLLAIFVFFLALVVL